MVNEGKERESRKQRNGQTWAFPTIKDALLVARRTRYLRLASTSALCLVLGAFAYKAQDNYFTGIAERMSTVELHQKLGTLTGGYEDEELLHQCARLADRILEHLERIALEDSELGRKAKIYLAGIRRNQKQREGR